jgi:hypothetical protein
MGIPHPDIFARRKACVTSREAAVFFTDFNKNWNVSTNFNKTAQYQM